MGNTIQNVGGILFGKRSVKNGSVKTLPTAVVSAAKHRRFAPYKIKKSKDTAGKNDQARIKNAGIPTGIFEGLLKTSSFLTAPIYTLRSFPYLLRSSVYNLFFIPLSQTMPEYATVAVGTAIEPFSENSSNISPISFRYSAKFASPSFNE